MAVSIGQISCEHHRAALGIAESSPRVSWRFAYNAAPAVNWKQSAYDIEVVRPASRFRQTYHVQSSQSVLVPWPSHPLDSAEHVEIRVRAHGQPGQLSTTWSEYVSIETGLLSASDWRNAVPIAAARQTEAGAPKRPIYFRKAFSVGPSFKKARLYITALGIYEAEINGIRLGDHVLAPGWQSYKYRHVYDTYDVTQYVSAGSNAIGVAVGEGWFSGRLGDPVSRNLYGDTLGLLTLLVVTNDDNSVSVVPTDTTWQATTGPIITSELYDGELYDHSLTLDNWSSASFDSSNWLDTLELPPLAGALVPPDGPPVRRMEERAPSEIFKSKSGATILNFGQNLVGWLRVAVDGPFGTRIELLHTEVLEDGEPAKRPLRSAKATDTLLLSGKGPVVWEPKFTFHGFQYVQVTGWPDGSPLDANSITAVVIHSDMERTGHFQCSNPLLTKLEENIVWSMKGNFVSLPTDCPQRDERLGWTGDIHAFAPTANFLYDTSGLLRGWHKDVWLEQQASKKMIVPVVVPGVPATQSMDGATAIWGDVVVANPWNLYQSYGDIAMLKEQYRSAKEWIDVGVARREPDGLWVRDTFQFADWLDPLAPPDKPGKATTAPLLVADAYLVHMTEMLSEISATLGLKEDAAKYAAQHGDLINRFHDAWIKPDDTLSDMTQTALTLALEFGIYRTAEAHSSAAKALRQIVAKNDYLVGTGFAGTHLLGFALSHNNASDDFYRMLLQQRCPSWLYQVVLGGTTTWERWDSMNPDNTVNPGEMTSFNHYAVGSVGNWIHTHVGGISPAEPGWKIFNVAPVPGGGIQSASIDFLSPYGQISVKWWAEKNDQGKDTSGSVRVRKYGLYLTLTVPPNSSAIVTLPGHSDKSEVGSGYYEYFVEDYKVPE